MYRAIIDDLYQKNARFSKLIGIMFKLMWYRIIPTNLFATRNIHIIYFITKISRFTISIDFCRVLDKYYVGELVDNELPVFPQRRWDKI